MTDTKRKRCWHCFENEPIEGLVICQECKDAAKKPKAERKAVPPPIKIRTRSWRERGRYRF